MANGFMDFLTGGGAYADPNQVDPNTGAPYGAVRQAFFNQLGNVGAALMAAGQPVEPAVRAQLLAQAGGFGSGMQRDIFNASQARLMQSQVQTAEQERQRLRNLGERINDPEFLKGIGLTKDQAMALGPKGIADVLEKKATQDPLDRAVKAAQLKEYQSKADRSQALRQMIYQFYGVGQPAAAGSAPQVSAGEVGGAPQVTTNAPAAAPTPGTFPSQGARPMMTPEMAFRIADDPEKALADITKSQLEMQGKAMRTLPPEEVRRLGINVGPNTIVQQSATGEITFKEPKDEQMEARQLGAKTQIEYVNKELRPKAEQAANTILPNLNRMDKLLTNEIITGAAANQELAIRKLSSLLWPGSSKAVTNTEQLRALMAENVLPYMSAFGGSDTVEEMRLVQGIVAGDIALERSTIEAVVRGMRRSALNAIELYDRERATVEQYMPKGAGIIKPPSEYKVLGERK
jgi:hypothetical protein